MIKKELRKELIKKRDLITHREEKTRKIMDNFFKMDIYKKSVNIMLYHNIKSEVYIADYFSKILSDCKRIILPKIDSNDKMVCSLLDSSGVKLGKYNIYEPVNQKLFDEKLIDIVVVPGVAFDENFNRMGYGGGYYDRFLKSISSNIVALCYDEQIVHHLISDEYDVKVHMIVTPTKFLEK